MLPSKSDYGPMPAPQSVEYKIEHKDPSLTVSSRQVSERGEFEAVLKYSTDGKETTNEIRGNPMKSVAKWNGDVLEIESKGKFGDNEFSVSAKWSLSADGKELTIRQHMASAMGEADMKIVFEKQ